MLSSQSLDVVGNIYIYIYIKVFGRRRCRLPSPRLSRLQGSEVKVPLDKFEATSFGRVVQDAGTVKPEEINALGFMLGDKKAGPFKMEIEWIKVERAAK